MSEKKKSNFTFILFALAAVLLFTVLYPMVTRGCVPQAAIPELTDEARATYLGYIASQYQKPSEFILKAFRNHDVVYLGDSFSHNTFSIVRGVLPRLYEQGVHAMGIEFVLAEDQAAVDALLTADEYDEGKARDIVTDQFISIAYQETLCLFKDIWTFNHKLDVTQPPLRLVGLGVKIIPEYFTKDEYRDNKELQKKALGNMTLDEGFFRIIDAEIIQKKERALLYMSTYNCFKNVKMKSFADYYTSLGLEFKGTVAFMTKALLKDRQMSVLFHNVWQLNEKQSMLFPVGGVFEAVFRETAPDKRATVFTVASSPFADLVVAPEFVGIDGKPVLFKDLCDAYVLNGSLSGYRFTPLEDGAIEGRQLEKIYRGMGVDPSKAKAKTPVEFIALTNEQIMKGNSQIGMLPH